MYGVPVLILFAIAGCSMHNPTRPSVSVAPGRVTVQAQERHAFPLIVGNPSGLVPMRWSRVAAERKVLVISASKQGCTTPVGAIVDRQGATVRITVYGQKVSGNCTAEGVDIVGYVKMDRPISDITVTN